LPDELLWLVVATTLVGLFQTPCPAFNPLNNENPGKGSGTFVNRNHLRCISDGCARVGLGFRELFRPSVTRRHWLSLLRLFFVATLVSG
jgi:hypothetical protein